MCKTVSFTDSVVFSFDGDNAGAAPPWALDAALPNYATDVRTVKFCFLWRPPTATSVGTWGALPRCVKTVP
jgi:DNA primase